MEYTLTTAAEATGISRSTIHRAIQKGRLSARKMDDGTLRIDGAELARVYPPSQSRQVEPSPWDVPGSVETPRDDGGTELSVLRLQVKMLEDQIGRERELRDQERATTGETVDDLRKRLDRAEERVLALSAPSQVVLQASQERLVETVARVEHAKASRGFLARLLGL